MNELVIDLNSDAFDFSKDSLIKETLLKGLLARQSKKQSKSGDARTSISLDDLEYGEPKLPRGNQSREAEPPFKSKGRGL
jgi:hypothetical protein